MKKYLLIMLLLNSTIAFAAISKWIDSDGQVHYSDQPPPPDTKSKTLRTDSQDNAAASGVASPKTLAEREADLKKAQLANKEASDKDAKKQAAAAAQQASCDIAHQNLRTLQSGIRMVEIDEKGERNYIDDKQRESDIAKAQKDISNYCK